MPSATIERAVAIGAHADHRRGHYAFARTQREAGIAHIGWEHRLKPLRPILYYLAAAVAWTLFAISLAWALLSA